MFARIRNIFSSATRAKVLHSEISSQRNRIKNLVHEHIKLSNWNDQYAAALAMLTDALEAMIWKKDADHRYTLANPTHCRAFFGFEGSTKCLQHVIGKTDNELLSEVFKDHGTENTFGCICLKSDEYCMTTDKRTHFLEAGVIDENEYLLYSIKTPQFDKSKKFIGTIGIAWDVTREAEFLLQRLDQWIIEEKVIKLHHADQVFSYALEPEAKTCSIFKHVCPRLDTMTIADCELTCPKTDFCPRKKGIVV